MQNLIVLDDEEGFKFLFEHHFKDLIRSESLNFSYHSTKESVVSKLNETTGDTVIVCDVHLAGECGLKFAHSVEENYPNVSIILTSGRDPKDESFKFCEKPIDFDKLYSMVTDSFNLLSSK